MRCPACRAERAVAFYDGGLQPLATLARFSSAAQARDAKKLPLDYVRCVRCGHVFNQKFDEAMVPTSGTHPGWGMFNGASEWNDFLRATAWKLADGLSNGAHVIEIGHGGGEFLRMMADRRSDLACTGYDPWGAESEQRRPSLRRELLPPDRIAALGAELVVIRHVLEHLAAPLEMLVAIGGDQRVYLEVPCIDRAIANARTADFFYEHAQQFTTASFVGMCGRAGTIEAHGHGYDGEVVWAIARLGKPSSTIEPATDFAGEAAAFDAATRAARASVRAELEALDDVAIWGGAGKGAAFIARYALDADRFPIVVDSDPSKVGTFVAGTGQEIRAPEWLLAHPAANLVVPAQWRARDILHEMKRKGIGGRVLIEHGGRMIDYARDPHPYAR